MIVGASVARVLTRREPGDRLAKNVIVAAISTGGLRNGSTRESRRRMQLRITSTCAVHGEAENTH
jgi:hypothetical protein